MTAFGGIECPLPSRRQIHSPAPAEPAPGAPSSMSPYPSRRSLHARAAETASPSSEMAPPWSEAPIALLPDPPAAEKRAPAPHRVGRTSLLVALAAMTVAIPVTGFVGPQSSVSLPVRAIGKPVGGVSWADGVSGGVAQATDLSATVTAASRAKARTPLETTGCLATDTAANGSRPVVETPELLWPLTQGSYTITSGFSIRISPISGQLLAHEGVDMSAPLGTPIHAVADGVVVEVSSDYRSGTYVRIQHTAPDGSTFYSAYAHEYMEDILVHQGDTVTAGEQIGAVGSNGWSTGPHLHFEIRDASDTAVEPLGWMEAGGAVYLGQECG